ncbi:MAG TPA: CoA transferase [Chloroflexota bacterium]|nr:CoA transferase [Chloroflexota bacterium]
MTSLAPETTNTAAGRTPLHGIRVLDFSHILAGPFCTRLLADLGAEVLKVESSTRMDRTGVTKPDPSFKGRVDRPPSFINTNRNKRSITLNLKTEAAREVTRRLASVADVIVENFSAGVMGRLGLDYDDLAPLNPGLVYVSMAGYGHSGPRRDWTSMNMNLQAYTGLMMVTGAEDDPPTCISSSWNDYIGGLHATFGVLNALTERRVTGRGANLDLAQFEASVSTLGPLLLASSINEAPPARLGNRSTNVAPQGCYRCAGKDEWVVISVRDDDEWRRLVETMGSPAWATDARFAHVTGRLRHHDEIDANIEAWTSELENTDVENRLQRAGVATERMRRVKDVMADPRTSSVFKTIEDPPGYRFPVTGAPFAFSRSTLTPVGSAAALGADTHPALREWLGLSDEEIESLGQAGALV